MRILITTIAVLFVAFISFWIIKFWERSQVYIEYKHPLFEKVQASIEFIEPRLEQIKETIEKSSANGENSVQGLYLNVTITADQKLVIPTQVWSAQDKAIRYSQYEEIKSKVLLVSDYKEILKTKKIIFNIIDNAQAVHEIFLFNMKEIGFEHGNNYIVTSQYEAPIKSLKDIAPALIFGSTQPEILKIVAMDSMHLIEAATIRADVIIHPIFIKNQLFFTPELISEFQRRHKKIVVGPLEENQKAQALALSPYGIILKK